MYDRISTEDSTKYQVPDMLGIIWHFMYNFRYMKLYDHVAICVEFQAHEILESCGILCGISSTWNFKIMWHFV